QGALLWVGSSVQLRDNFMTTSRAFPRGACSGRSPRASLFAEPTAHDRDGEEKHARDGDGGETKLIHLTAPPQALKVSGADSSTSAVIRHLHRAAIDLHQRWMVCRGSAPALRSGSAARGTPFLSPGLVWRGLVRAAWLPKGSDLPL